MSEVLVPPAGEPLPAPGGRAALRRRRRRQRRRRVVAVLAVAVLATLLVTVYFARRDSPLPSTAAVRGRVERTLLLQLQGPEGNGTGNVLLAHDPAQKSGAGLLVPPQVLAVAPGSQPMPYGQVLGTLGPEASRKALADLLGVTVDAGWVLDLPTTARFVDALGGIRVTVDVPVLTGTTVVLQPGEQPVDGASAVAFATYRAPGEQEQARLARLQELLDGILEVLPTSAAQVAGLLDTLGRGSALTGTDVPGLASTLVGLAADEKASALQYDLVPVIAVDTGAASPSLRLDANRSRAVVDRLLGASVPSAQRQSGNRVLVFNGVGTPFLGDQVRDALTPAGLLYVPGGNASSFDVPTTEVQVPDATPASLALGRRVAQALGVPDTAVHIGQATSVADVVVVVGADFGAGGTGASPG